MPCCRACDSAIRSAPTGAPVRASVGVCTCRLCERSHHSRLALWRTTGELLAALRLNVALDDFATDVSGGADEVRARPERGHPLQRGKLFAEESRATPFHQTRDVGWQRVGVGAKEQMHMVRLNRQPNHLPVTLFSYLMDNRRQPIMDRIRSGLCAVAWDTK